MYQVTAINSNGTRYPIAWFAKHDAASEFVEKHKKKWQGLLIHEVTTVIMLHDCIDRSRFEIW